MTMTKSAMPMGAADALADSVISPEKGTYLSSLKMRNTRKISSTRIVCPPAVASPAVSLTMSCTSMRCDALVSSARRSGQHQSRTPYSTVKTARAANSMLAIVAAAPASSATSGTVCSRKVVHAAMMASESSTAVMRAHGEKLWSSTVRHTIWRIERLAPSVPNRKEPLTPRGCDAKPESEWLRREGRWADGPAEV